MSFCINLSIECRNDRIDGLRKLKDAIRLSCENKHGSSDGAKVSECIKRLENLIDESSGFPITLIDVAYLLDLEPTYCCKIFRRVAGESFSSWSRRIRIEKAKKLLRHSSLSVTEVAMASGYADVTTFGRNFRRCTSVSPSEFRKEAAHKRSPDLLQDSARMAASLASENEI